MPNHVKNIIHICSDSETIQNILLAVQNDDVGIGSFDFNKLIPMPKSLEIECSSRTNAGLALYRAFLEECDKCSLEVNVPGEEFEQIRASIWNKYAEKADPETLENGKKAYENLKAYGYPTWYEWANAEWGTKWNAYDCEEYRGGNALAFSTAWSSVPKILTALSEKYPAIQFRYLWADEDIGYNVGYSAYLGGEVTESYIPAGGTKEAYELAAEIRGCDLARDYGLFLTEDESTYEYREEDESEGPEI